MEIIRDFKSKLERRLAEDLQFLQVVLGPRQVGKTTALKQILEAWQGSKLMISADSLAPPNIQWIETQWQKARNLPPPTLLIFDEIQKIPNWSEAIKILFDEDRSKKNLKVVLLGSASTSIQKGLSESLVGRFELIRANHWDFSESKKAFQWNLEKFLCFGGYPAAAELIDDTDRWQHFIKNSIIEPVLTKDLQGLVSIQKPALFRQTFDLAMHYPAQEISLQKLLGQLQDRGNVTTIKYYLELFEGAFLLRVLQKYSNKPLKVRSSSPKILPLCPALVQAFSPMEQFFEDRSWRGRIFELAIGAHLNSHFDNLFYWRDGKFEVDFVVEFQKKIYAIEVKSGRKKNYRGLDVFLKKFPQSIPILIDEAKGHDFLLEKDLPNVLISGKY